MQSITIPKITVDELNRFRIVFLPVDSEEIYMTKLNPLQNREQLRVLGYEQRNRYAHTPLEIKEGNYLASRFRLMCINCKIKPTKIKTMYDRSKVFQTKVGRGNKSSEVDGIMKEAVWSVVCDGL